VSGRQLAGALIAIALLTFVLPPLASWQVNVSRVNRAHDEAKHIAELAVRDDGTTTGIGPGVKRVSPLVLAGPGAAPKFADGSNWPEQRATSALSAQPDPWGNHYLVVMPTQDNNAAIVVSAGPNGVVETQFGATTAAEDDIVVLKRRD